MADEPWYKDGLQFQCSQCGDCCTGGPGYVWVTNDEIHALAQLVQMEDDAFKQQYVRKVGVRKSLIEYENGDCVFFHPEKRNCTVYEARPRQCRTWPFWDSNLRSPEAWKQTCEACPGSGQGKLYQLDYIEQQRKVFSV